LGASEILLVVGIILVFVLISRGQKSKAIKRQEAEKAEALRAAQMPGRSIRYPELQLLGFVVVLAGIAMAGAGYLMSRGIVDPLSLGGIFIIVLGLSFVILARQRARPGEGLTSSKRTVGSPADALKPAQKKIKPSSVALGTQIKPEDVADFKRYQALKAKAAEKP
jgi:drug/metabolite transporter (DMT)-like permease